LVAVLGVAACTPANRGGTEAAAAVHPAAATLGTILSIRTVTAPGGGSVLHAALLADTGDGTACPAGGGQPMMEFIVREDDGAVISIVQSNDLGFQPGDRVSIRRADRVRLARPG